VSRCSCIRLSLLAVLCLTAGLFALGTDPSQEPTPLKGFKDAKAHKVVRIIDGDTVIIDLDGKETRVRLIGVDTPETVHPRKPVEFYDKEASRFTTNLLKGESVYVEYDQQKQDRYGRTLAYLYRAPDGLFVNLEIVRQGYGHAYTKYPFKYLELFHRHERAAREAGRGLWSENLRERV
jgi:micrococcal nuclease